MKRCKRGEKQTKKDRVIKILNFKRKKPKMKERERKKEMNKKLMQPHFQSLF